MSRSISDDEGPQDARAYWGSPSGSQRTGARLGSTSRVASISGSSTSTRGGSSEKGKGKAAENGEDGADQSQGDTAMNENGSTTGTSDAELDRAKRDLQLLANLDPTTAEKLVELDPTPTEDLLTTVKIMKAISILTSACSVMQEMNDSYETSQSLPLSTYSDIVQLLSSALSDVNQSNPTLRSPPKPLSLHHLEVARAKLSLPLQDAVPPQAPVERSEAVLVASSLGHSVILPAPPAPPSELSLLFAENARLALAALRPSSLFPSPYYGSSAMPASPTDTSQQPAPPPPVGPSYISKLPSELLIYVLQFAHSAAAEHDNNEAQNRSLGPSRAPIVREVWNGRGRRSVRDEYGNPVNGITGSKGAAQRFTLSLARVCKAWVEPSRTVAFRHVYLNQGPQLVDLLSSLNSSPSLKRAVSSIQSISAILSPPGSNEPPSVGGPGGASLNRMLGHIVGMRPRPGGATPHFTRGRSDKEGSSSGGKGEEGKSPAENWSQIVEQCPNVRRLKLRILPSANRWAGFARTPSTTEFLDAAVLGTLSSTRSLRNLNLAFSIDFEELEIVMNGLPNLESLSIRAIDAISGSPAVNSTSPHPAKKIRHFKLGDANSGSPYHLQEYTSISDVQLAWLIEPAISNGSLKDLEVSILIDPGVGGGWPPGIPGGPGNFAQNGTAPPFASSTFADLLIRCGSNLERLVVQDLGETRALNTNFAAAPHNSNFDYALASLTSLNTLSLQFHYTGAAFLASLSQIPHLRTLSLSGTPTHTSAEGFADKLEHGLGELETLSITGQFAGTRGGQGGWNGAGVRRVKQAAKDRGLQGAFGS